MRLQMRSGNFKFLSVAALCTIAAACASAEKNNGGSRPELGSTSSQEGSTQVTTEREVPATVIQQHNIPTVRISLLRGDLNRMQPEHFQALGLPKDVSQNIVKLRDDRGGKFGSIEELKQATGMNDQLYDEIKTKVAIG